MITENNTHLQGAPEYTQHDKNGRGTIISLYDGKCFVTKERITPSTSGEFEAYHLYCRSSYPEKALDSNNGVLIKKEIHPKFHQLYSGVGNVPEQFETFWIENYNIREFPWKESGYNEICDKMVQRYKKSPDFFSDRLNHVVENREHVLIRYDNIENKYVNEHTYIIIACCKHSSQNKSLSLNTLYKGWNPFERKTVGVRAH